MIRGWGVQFCLVIFVLWVGLLSGCDRTELIGVRALVDTERNVTGTGRDSAGPYRVIYFDTGVETVPDAESESSLWGSDADSDTTGALMRVAFNPPAGLDLGYIWIPSDQNILDIQGRWYGYHDDSSWVSVREEGNATICVEGAVGQYLEKGWTFSGAGVSLCDNGADIEPVWQLYPLESCPFHANLDEELVGVSFELSWTVPAKLQLQFKEVGSVYPGFIELTTAGRADYLFADSTNLDGLPTTDPAKVTGVQFQVGNSPNGAVPFSFCITNLELLVRR